jgi:PPOX class probable F420-dependent enzyme
MENPASLAAARIRRFLEEEPVVWLSTVRPSGAPHIVPIWFWWDGAAVLVFSKPEAQKVRNLRSHPSVMLGVGDAEDDFDIGLLEGRAELLDRPTAEVVPPAHLEKYAERMAEIGLTADEYVATYSQVIRIVPSHYLGWHGRNVPRSARVAGAPSVSIEEPATERPGLIEWLGEPLSRGLRGLGSGRLRPASIGAL